MLRYTYRIECTKDLDSIWAGFRENARREIRKAQRRVEVLPLRDVEAFVATLRKMPSRGHQAADESVVRRIADASLSRECLLMLVASDSHGEPVACALLVSDNACLYYLLAERNDHDGASGAPSLLIWESIRHAHERGLAFDFEGSMIQPVERFFRAFGARQLPYVRVTRARSRGQLLLALRSLGRRPPL